MRRLARRLAFLCVLALTLGPHRAKAQPVYEELSELEKDVLDEVLAQRGYSVVQDPQGRRIESIEIVRLEVFDDRDPVPNWVNWFHTTSRDRIIRRELLFYPGQVYNPARVAETARNLRSFRQVSLVVIVPIEGSTPDRVRVLVITKDVWSLRLNSDFQVDRGNINYLLLAPSEENLFGTHTTVGLLYILEQDTHTLGGRVIHPRLFGSRVELGASVNLLYNRDTLQSEGSFGSAFYGQPLFSLATEWGWLSAVAWRDEITRRFIGAEPRTFDVLLPSGQVVRIPEQYFTERLAGYYQVQRSFGLRHKLDLSLGVEADRRRFEAPDLSAFPEPARELFRREVLPVSDTRLSPFFQVRAYDADFVWKWNLETLGLQEDYRMGYDVLLRIYPASRAVGSTRDLVGVVSALGYTVPLGTGMARAVATSTIEVANDGKDDALLDVQLRIVTPRMDIGRVHFDTLLLNRYENYLNRAPFRVGGDTRLRGYAPQQFQGKDAVAANLEYRTNSIDILSAQVGGALFYDVADAFDGFSDVDLKQSAGFGVRMLFPQADRLVLRADWGFPLSQGFDTLPGAWFLTFGQAFSMPGIVSPSVTTQTATN